MKVILQQDVKGQGKKGQMVESPTDTPATSFCPGSWPSLPRRTISTP